MSYIGFYRYKFSPSVDSDVEFYINDILEATKTVKVREWCTGFKKLRFLNKDGQYRFFPFNQYFSTNDKAKEIGRANKIITSLLESQSSEISVGIKNERIISLNADDVSQTELDVLSDLWTSPRVYLYVGDGITDIETDWILVSVKSKNSIVKISKGAYIDLKIDVTLPEHYSINML